MAFFASLLFGLALGVVAWVIAPRPKQAKPPQVTEMENPTADRGRPIPVVFGTMTIKSGNVLWYGDKRARTRSVRDGGGGKSAMRRKTPREYFHTTVRKWAIA